MNLNPLKKDNNTDALVKALEDANGANDATNYTNPANDVAADAQQTMQPTPALDTPNEGQAIVDPAATPVSLNPDESATSTDAASGAPAEPLTVTDPAASLTFDGNDLPAGLSADPAATDSADSSLSGNNDIDTVKRSALEQLRPLIEKLDLEPADKFDKYLMMLRASDDPALIKPAFDAAQGITGEKEKAQALLDIINEINYITANQQQ